LGLLAQESSVKGNLRGTVFDSTGAVVTRAKVAMTGPTGNRTTMSDSEGRFTFDLLTPGYYSVRAEQTGFKATEIKQVEVYANRASTIRLTLEPGGSDEVVEVTAASIGVEEASTKLETSLNDTFYSQVPVARNVTGLFYAAAGVNEGGGTGAANPSIAGGSGLENQYMADGVNITVTFVDTLQSSTDLVNWSTAATTSPLVIPISSSGQMQFFRALYTQRP